jgi:glucokinase
VRAGTTRTLRRRNIDTVVTVVQRQGVMTRSEIAHLTGLSVPTVNRVVTELLQRGLLKEVDSAPDTTGPGRPAAQVMLNPESGYIAAIGISEHQTEVALANVTGEVLALSNVATRGEEGGDATLRNILHGMEENLIRSGIRPTQIATLAVGVPGTVHQDQGIVLDAPNIHGWRNFDLRQAFQVHYPAAEILVENDVNYAALGELNFVSEQRNVSLIFLAFRKGIGSGIILNGQLYRGASGLAGEVGFMALGRDFHYDTDRGLGHLETLAGEASLLADLHPEHRGKYDTLEELFDAAKRSDPDALRVVNKALSYYAVTVANVAVLFDPDTIVIGGDLCTWPEYSLEKIEAGVHELIPAKPKITLSQLGHQATLYGAIYQAKDHAQRSLALNNIKHT